MYTLNRRIPYIKHVVEERGGKGDTKLLMLLVIFDGNTR